MTDHNEPTIEQRVDAVRKDIVDVFSRLGNIEDKIDRRIDTLLGRVSDSEYSHAIVIGYTAAVLALGIWIGNL